MTCRKTGVKRFVWRLQFPFDLRSRRIGRIAPLGLILDLSRDGACLELSGHLDSLAEHQVIQLILVGPIAQPIGAPASKEADDLWTARVIWTRILRINTTSRPETASKGRFQLGVRFENLSAAQEYRLRSITMPAIGPSHDLAEPMADTPVVTVSHALRNREGHMIALCHDAPRQAQATPLPVVLLCSGYGMTQQAYVAFAYFLAGAGLRVLRYDHSCHIWASATVILPRQPSHPWKTTSTPSWPLRRRCGPGRH